MVFQVSSHLAAPRASCTVGYWSLMLMQYRYTIAGYSGLVRVKEETLQVSPEVSETSVMFRSQPLVPTVPSTRAVVPSDFQSRNHCAVPVALAVTLEMALARAEATRFGAVPEQVDAAKAVAFIVNSARSVEAPMVAFESAGWVPW